MSGASVVRIAALLPFLGPPLAGGDWPRLLGPGGDGRSEETELAKSLEGMEERLLWSRPVGTGYSAPSILGGILVLHHREGSREVVEAMEAGSGATLWKHGYASRFVDPFGYNNGPRSTPFLGGGRCYAFGAEGRLLCLELETGRLVWTRDTASDYRIPQAFFGVGSSPLLVGHRLMVMVGGQPGAGMVAFHAGTGEALWESVGRDSWQGLPKRGWRGEPRVEWREHAKQASYATPALARIGGRDSLLCLMRQGLVSLAPETGEVRFSYWFRSPVDESVNAMNPVVEDGRILLSSAYYGYGSVLLEADGEGGGEVSEVWRNRALEMHWATPILHQGHLYAISGRRESDASFRCVEWDTGRLLWERDESWRRFGGSDDPAYGRGSMILADDKLVVLGEAGLLGLFRPRPDRPRELSRYQVPGLEYPCWTAPVLSERRLYLRSEDRLVCYDLSAGPPGRSSGDRGAGPDAQ